MNEPNSSAKVATIASVSKTAQLMALAFAFILTSLVTATTSQPSGFGSKVHAVDFDLGYPLNDVCVQFAYRDIGEVPNNFDQKDPVYIDMDINSIADLNDIRLTPFSTYPPGSKVRQTDPDIDYPIKNLEGWSLVFSDLGPNDIYDLQDPVYLHNESMGNAISSGDIRLTFCGDFPAGSRVRRSDSDEGRLVSDLAALNKSDQADIRFYNANGNFIKDDFREIAVSPLDGSPAALYDAPDSVYLHISFLNRSGRSGSSQSAPSMRLVDANDLRLSI